MSDKEMGLVEAARKVVTAFYADSADPEMLLSMFDLRAALARESEKTVETWWRVGGDYCRYPTLEALRKHFPNASTVERIETTCTTLSERTKEEA